MPAQSREAAKDDRTDKASRHILAPKKELTVCREDAFITFFPENTQRLTYGIDESREASIIGKQWFSWAPSEDQHYRWGIAPARTYAPSLQVCWLYFSRCSSSFFPGTLLPLHTTPLLRQIHVFAPSRCMQFGLCKLCSLISVDFPSERCRHCMLCLDFHIRFLQLCACAWTHWASVTPLTYW